MKSPIRLNGDMLAVLGGKGHRLFKQFVKWSCQAYVRIRSHAAELEVLLRLMQNAGIEHLGVGEEVAQTVARVRQTLRLWLDEAGARAHMEKVLLACLSSKGQDHLETIHTVAMAFKN